MLPAIPVASPNDVAPGESVSSWVSLLGRDGSTLRVTLVAPFCGSNYQRHLLETGAVIVVWATGAPGDDVCAVAVTKIETLTSQAPVRDRPVIDSTGGLVLPDTPGRPIP